MEGCKIPEITITNPSEIMAVSWRFCVEMGINYPVHVFRGQSNVNWKLEPSLCRMVPGCDEAIEIAEIEDMLLDRFCSQAHLHLPAEQIPARRSDKLAWWMLMQHYGVPTRLLDWTKSFWVALYFAVEADWQLDGCVFVSNTWAFDRAYRESEEFVLACPPRQTSRMIAQQGVLMSSNRVLRDFLPPISENLLATKISQTSMLVGKVIIPSSLKRIILRWVHSMSICGDSLFPGIEGVGRGAAEMARLATNGGPRIPIPQNCE